MKIDHHLQLTMLRKLAGSEDLIRYSDLKEGDTENSLFSYHLNKLIDRGMVDRNDDGYSLSINGARWLNDNGFRIAQNEAPRVMIALVVQNAAGDYLVAQRAGQLKSTINDYMLLTHQYVNSDDIDDQIRQAIDRYVPGGSVINRTDFGFVQIKATYDLDARVMRNLFCVVKCQVAPFDPPEPTPSASYSWMSEADIRQLDHPSATILRAVINYMSDDSNHHGTPLFAS